MIPNADAIDVLSRRGWLSEQPSEFRKRLLADAKIRRYPAGKTVHAIGDRINDFLGLADGALEIYIRHPQLGEGLIHIAQPGIWLGEHRAFGFTKRILTVRAKYPVTLIAVPGRTIDRMIADDPGCLKNFGRLSQLHLVECMNAELNLASDNI